jgi:ATP-dependent RNA helicase DDX19/DBP5
LAPTYELALQIGDVTERMAKHMKNVKIGYAVKGERSKFKVEFVVLFVKSRPITMLN